MRRKKKSRPAFIRALRKFLGEKVRTTHAHRHTPLRTDAGATRVLRRRKNRDAGRSRLRVHLRFLFLARFRAARRAGTDEGKA